MYLQANLATNFGNALVTEYKLTVNGKFQRLYI